MWQMTNDICDRSHMIFMYVTDDKWYMWHMTNDICDIWQMIYVTEHVCLILNKNTFAGLLCFDLHLDWFVSFVITSISSYNKMHLMKKSTFSILMIVTCKYPNPNDILMLNKQCSQNYG